ncbi:MAG: hypothetical protein ACK6DS_05445 [Planctomycetota bacterium]
MRFIGLSQLTIQASRRADEQSDGPKRWIDRYLMGNLLATARSSAAFVDEEQMIDSVNDFADRLNRLDPNEVAFVLRVDELVDQTSPATLQIAYPAIFRFFETHPENDCGMPGTLVHMMEDHYPNYVDELIESIGRTPSTNTVLMVNRILNSKIDGALRSRLIECLQTAIENENASRLVVEESKSYLERHT